uniref:Large ribosomal subunit protein uL22m n=1 Tax=Strigamia maritima TaxID=126957 RepID=T1IIB9_STRMM
MMLPTMATLRATRFLPSISVFNNLFHTSTTNLKMIKGTGEVVIPEGWTAKNKMVYPPQELGEERRPAWVCHMRGQIRYSPKKMYYVAILVRGLTVDEALKQLSFLPDKGAAIAKEVIEEAQEMAVRDHNVEYKSNLWVADSFCSKGHIFKGLRRHSRARWGEIRYNYMHYYVKLQEGLPPKHYCDTYQRDGNEKLEEFLKNHRQKFIQKTP